jgi:hypothetical protein
VIGFLRSQLRGHEARHAKNHNGKADAHQGKLIHTHPAEKCLLIGGVFDRGVDGSSRKIQQNIDKTILTQQIKIRDCYLPLALPNIVSIVATRQTNQGDTQWINQAAMPT